MTKKNENRKEIMRERNNTRMIRVANINRCKIIAFRMMRREREREKMLPLGLVIRHVSK